MTPENNKAISIGGRLGEKTRNFLTFSLVGGEATAVSEAKGRPLEALTFVSMVFPHWFGRIEEPHA